MKKIAICDDDINLLSTFKKILSRIGCDVYLSKNEKELHEHLAANEFDIVIVDYNLDPEDFEDLPKNGLQIISEIRNQYAERDMKLVLTTSPNCAEIVDVKNAGGDEILMKPFSPITKITDLLSSLTNGECNK